MVEIAAADEGEHGTGFGLGGDGGVLEVAGVGAGRVVFGCGVRPGFLALERMDGMVEFGFQPRLPGGVEGGVDVQAAGWQAAVVENAFELVVDGFERVGGLVAAGLGEKAWGPRMMPTMMAHSLSPRSRVVLPK